LKRKAYSKLKVLFEERGFILWIWEKREIFIISEKLILKCP